MPTAHGPVQHNPGDEFMVRRESHDPELADPDEEAAPPAGDGLMFEYSYIM